VCVCEGGLDGFLDSDDDGAADGWGSAHVSESSSDDDSGSGKKRGDSSDEDSDDDNSRPEIMGDEDLSD
jgi:hypothetical protein